VQGNGDCYYPDISANGRFVVFESDASNLVAGDTNARRDIFCHDRQTGSTTRVSVGVGGTQSTGLSQWASVSADGRFVAFQGNGDDLVPGDMNLGPDIFVHDRQNGTTVRASTGTTAGQTFATSRLPSISDDGSCVSYYSNADDLVAGDTNFANDVFVYERLTAAITRVSISTAGNQASGSSWASAVSADGRFVAFESDANDLVGGDTNSRSDVFVRDRQLGTTVRISVDSAGAQANDGSYAPSIAGDGHLVAWRSTATNLVVGDTNAVADIFVRDQLTNSTTRVSVGATGQQATAPSAYHAMSPDGRYVAFDSTAANLVLPDVLGNDVFVRELDVGGAFATYGTGCAAPGLLGVPSIAGLGTPRLGNAAFAFGVGKALPSSVAVAALSLTQANVPFSGCSVLVGGAFVTSPTVFLDAAGGGAAPFPLPTTPSLVGTVVYAQFLVYDPNGPFLGDFTMSYGLAVMLGS
jgi:hypothetical protein